jgi:hypothetical protein
MRSASRGAASPKWRRPVRTRTPRLPRNQSLRFVPSFPPLPPLPPLLLLDLSVIHHPSSIIHHPSFHHPSLLRHLLPYLVPYPTLPYPTYPTLLSSPSPRVAQLSALTISIHLPSPLPCVSRQPKRQWPASGNPSRPPICCLYYIRLFALPPSFLFSLFASRSPLILLPRTLFVPFISAYPVIEIHRPHVVHIQRTRVGRVLPSLGVPGRLHRKTLRRRSRGRALEGRRVHRR